jgi:two-component system response regulator AtoC
LIVVGDDQAAGNVPGAFASEEEKAALRWKVEELRAQVLRDQRERRRLDHDGLFEKSPRMKAIKQMIEQVADTDVTVLIWGESGVGKELVARAIHDSSVRRAGACIKVNCAALPPALLESELFGYERGAFTGAHRKKPGKFELADGGTMFLDEIGEMPLSLQAKLLQVLQDHEFSRLGSDRDIKVDVRVVASTNKDLEKAVALGNFREDLYYRLNVVNILVPRSVTGPRRSPPSPSTSARSTRASTTGRPCASPRRSSSASSPTRGLGTCASSRISSSASSSSGARTS